MANHVINRAQCHILWNNWNKERLIVITCHKCGQCYQRYNCLHHSCIAGRDYENSESSKYQNNQKLVMWGQLWPRWTRDTWQLGAYANWQCNVFEFNNVLVHHTLSKYFTEKDAYIYMKLRKSSLDCYAVYQNIYKYFLALVTWLGRLQKQRESCKSHTMMVRWKDDIGISKSHFTSNSIQ